jgi:hypothetical protein
MLQKLAIAVLACALFLLLAAWPLRLSIKQKLDEGVRDLGQAVHVTLS